MDISILAASEAAHLLPAAFAVQPAPRERARRPFAAPALAGCCRAGFHRAQLGRSGHDHKGKTQWHPSPFFLGPNLHPSLEGGGSVVQRRNPNRKPQGLFLLFIFLPHITDLRHLFFQPAAVP